jgi:hypothetical protein
MYLFMVITINAAFSLDSRFMNVIFNTIFLPICTVNFKIIEYT